VCSDPSHLTIRHGRWSIYGRPSTGIWLLDFGGFLNLLFHYFYLVSLTFVSDFELALSSSQLPIHPKSKISHADPDDEPMGGTRRQNKKPEASPCVVD
jgi:hypothetical protein